MTAMNTVNSEIFARFLFSENFANPWEMWKSLCHLQMRGKSCHSREILRRKYNFNTIPRNKILAKHSELTVTDISINFPVY